MVADLMRILTLALGARLPTWQYRKRRSLGDALIGYDLRPPQARDNTDAHRLHGPENSVSKARSSGFYNRWPGLFAHNLAERKAWRGRRQLMNAKPAGTIEDARQLILEYAEEYGAVAEPDDITVEM
jgi:hypothetical protein